MWKNFDDERPALESNFVVITSDGSGAGYYHMSKEGSVLDCECGFHENIGRHLLAGTVWCDVPPRLVDQWFILNRE